jgi:hypothetical protein
MTKRSSYIHRIVNFEPSNYKMIRRFAQRKGLGQRGFSAAVRQTLREYHHIMDRLELIHKPPPRLSSRRAPNSQTEE